jgi:hypothetical protein
MDRKTALGIARNAAKLFAGRKTYVLAFGLACHGIYLLTIGQWDDAYQAFVAASAIAGLRCAVWKMETAGSTTGTTSEDRPSRKGDPS